MKLITSVKNAAQSVWYKAGVLFTTMMACIASNVAYAANGLQATDLTQDTSGGKKFDDIATNIDAASKTGASLMIQLVTVGGFVVVAISLYTLYKASKDEREKPLPAIVGLFIGDAMAAVGSIMWIMRNTVVGAPAAG